MSRLTRRLSVIAVAAALAGILASCTPQDSATKAYLDGQNNGYVSGDKQVVEIPAEKRGEPVKFTGTDQDGQKVSDADYAGKVTVVNFWYAGCAPCRVEAPYLEGVYNDTKGDNVDFLGINVSDQADTAKSFMTDYKVTYPSIIDTGDGAAKIAFAKFVPLTSMPNTVILDRQGRVAVRIIGPVVGESALKTLVTELAAKS